MKLENKVAVVTGGASGIGSAICEAFARNGAIVTVADVDEPGARQLAGRLERAIAQVCDVTDPVAVDRAVDQVVADHGRLDILVNNAGIAGTDELAAGVERGLAQLGEMATGRVTTAIDVVRNLTDQQWRLMLATHLDGTFFCTRAALRHMVPQGSGVIINIGSIYGIEGGAGAPHYSAAKGAIHAFTRAVAKDAILQGIRVNTIAPGFVDTPLIDFMPDAYRAMIAVSTPGQRLGRPDEVAAAAVFLASDDSSWFIGQTLSPNGGAVMI